MGPASIKKYTICSRLFSYSGILCTEELFPTAEDSGKGTLLPIVLCFQFCFADQATADF